MNPLSRILSHLSRQVTVQHCATLDKCWCRSVASSSRRSMRIVQFKEAGEQCIGVRVDEGNVMKLSSSFPNSVCTALNLVGQQELLAEATRCLKSGDTPVSLSDVELLPPITRPDKVLCIGLNYKDHCEEVGHPLPTEPVVFSKFSSCITTCGDIAIPAVTKCIDYECELVVVIGKEAKDIPESEAMEYVLGYTAANDVSARDMVTFGQNPRNGGQFLTAKAMDNFCPLSTDLVTKDEIEDIQNLSISTKLDGEVKQCSNTKEMVFNVRQLIAHTSKLFTLLPGDIILTGTPAGVGYGKKPPVYVNSGETVEIEIEGIGKVVNRFV